MKMLNAECEMLNVALGAGFPTSHFSILHLAFSICSPKGTLHSAFSILHSAFAAKAALHSAFRIYFSSPVHSATASSRNFSISRSPSSRLSQRRVR